MAFQRLLPRQSGVVWAAPPPTRPALIGRPSDNGPAAVGQYLHPSAPTPKTGRCPVRRPTAPSAPSVCASPGNAIALIVSVDEAR